MKTCPCHSGLRYAACCEPFHLGGEPATPERLMRSRYAAFALGLSPYLVRTLSRDHPDRSGSWSRGKQRFAGLRILFAEADEVLFYARIYDGGADRSFAELSKFVQEDGCWRYASGHTVERERLPKDLSMLTRERFLTLY